MNNQSSSKIEGTKVSLDRNTQYVSQTPRKKIKFETLTVKEVFGSGVRSSGSVEFVVALDVPPLAPTNMNSCSVLNTSYQLKISAKVRDKIFMNLNLKFFRPQVEGAHKNPNLSIPIEIGTVPIRAQAPNYHSVMDSSIASSSSHPSAPPPIGFDLPPPSYTEATKIVPEMTENDVNVSVFNPRYPVWKFDQPSPPSAPTSPYKVPLV